MENRKNIFLLGAFSGKNVGDEALLESTLTQLSKKFINCQFFIPTRDTNNFNRYLDQFNIKSVDISFNFNIIKMIINYLTLLKFIILADLILIIASLFYEYKLFKFNKNPFLGIFPFIMFSKILTKKIGLYSAGIGPIYSPSGRFLIGLMLRRLDFLILRDKNSRKLAKMLGVDSKKLFVTADMALLTPKEPIKKILNKENLKQRYLGVNVNFYVDSFLSGNSKFNEEKFVTIISNVLNKFSKTHNFKIVFFIFCPYDQKITKKIIKNIRSEYQVIPYPKYNHLQINNLISKMNLFLGMRLHSLILSFSNNVPFISINYATKCMDFLDLIGEEKLGIDFIHFSEKSLMKKLLETNKNNLIIKKRFNLKSKKLERNLDKNNKIIAEYLK